MNGSLYEPDASLGSSHEPEASVVAKDICGLLVWMCECMSHYPPSLHRSWSKMLMMPEPQELFSSMTRGIMVTRVFWLMNLENIKVCIIFRKKYLVNYLSIIHSQENGLIRGPCVFIIIPPLSHNHSVAYHKVERSVSFIPKTILMYETNMRIWRMRWIRKINHWTVIYQLYCCHVIIIIYEHIR